MRCVLEKRSSIYNNPFHEIFCCLSLSASARRRTLRSSVIIPTKFSSVQHHPLGYIYKKPSVNPGILDLSEFLRYI